MAVQFDAVLAAVSGAVVGIGGMIAARKTSKESNAISTLATQTEAWRAIMAQNTADIQRLRDELLVVKTTLHAAEVQIAECEKHRLNGELELRKLQVQLDMLKGNQ